VHHVEAAPAVLFADDIGAAFGIEFRWIEPVVHRLGCAEPLCQRLGLPLESRSIAHAGTMRPGSWYSKPSTRSGGESEDDGFTLIDQMSFRQPAYIAPKRFNAFDELR
jgi:hypothetical protein